MDSYKNSSYEEVGKIQDQNSSEQEERVSVDARISDQHHKKMKLITAFAVLLAGTTAAFAGLYYEVDYLTAVGYSVMTAIIVWFTLSQLKLENVEEVVKKSQERLSDNIKRDQDEFSKKISALTVVEGAIEANVTNIYDGRQKNKNAEKDMMHDLEEAINNGDEIFLTGVSARSMLDTGTPWPFGNLIYKNRDNIKLKVLILHSEGEWARHRGKMETPHNPIIDIDGSIAFLESCGATQCDVPRRKSSKVKELQYKLMDLVPICFLFGTDHFLYLQPYPLIDREEIERRKRGVEKYAQHEAIGVKAPMIRLKGPSISHEMWVSHFNYLWNHEIKCRVISELKNPCCKIIDEEKPA